MWEASRRGPECCFARHSGFAIIMGGGRSPKRPPPKIGGPSRRAGIPEHGKNVPHLRRWSYIRFVPRAHALGYLWSLNRLFRSKPERLIGGACLRLA